MASIMKRGDSYSVRYKYKDHSGKPCEGWESFKTKKEAQERKITVEKELLDGTFLVPDTMTVEEMLYKWIPIQSTKHKWSPKTYTQSVAMVQNLIVPYIGKRKVQELRTYDIEKFYATLAKTPCGQYVKGIKQKLSEKQKKRLLSSTSIHEVHTLLKTAFSYAVEWDLIHKIPLPRDAPKVNIEERTIWDEKTMLAALQTIENPALHLAVHMSMILSLREGEILGLQPSDLDFDGLRHSSATYQLLKSDGDFKSVQGNTGHATASVLMDTYAHMQDKPRLELTEKIEANFYFQDLTPAASQPRQNEKLAATKISGKEILEAIRLIDADERRELTRALFA